MLLVTSDVELRDDVALIAAVVGARLETEENWQGLSTEGWAAVLCGADALPSSSSAAQQALLLGKDQDYRKVWEAASAMPSLRPVTLPAGEAWLGEYLASCVLDRMPGQVVATAGAFGGVGTTTIAFLLAAEAAAREQRVLLVDGDARPGSGLAAVLAEFRNRSRVGNQAHGLSWAEIAALEGTISAAQLEASLPTVEGIHVVTAGLGYQSSTREASSDGLGASELSVQRFAHSLERVLAAGQRAFDLVILDAGRNSWLLQQVSESVDVALAVTRPATRGVDAVAELMDSVKITWAVVLNGHGSQGWDSQEVSRALETQVVADLAEQKWLRRGDELSEAYELLRSRYGARLIGGLLEAVTDNG